MCDILFLCALLFVNKDTEELHFMY